MNSIRENKGDAHTRIIEMNEAVTSKFLNLVIEVFSGYANLMIFKERENDILVRARKTIKPRIWRSLNKVVEDEFGGKYSRIEGGWVIPKHTTTEEPISTGLPRIDEKLEALEREKEHMRGIDTNTGHPVSDQETAMEELELETDPKAVEGFRMIAVDALLTSPVKLRQSIDDEYIAGLAETIKEKGVIQPILVRPLTGERFQIVAGEQRYRTAQEVGLTELPCIVKKLNALEAFETALIENLQRKDLTAYEVAKALRRALDLFPGEYSSQSVLASKLGKNQPWVSRHLRMLELEGIVSSGELQKVTERQVRALLTVPKKKQLEFLREVKEGKEFPSAREIEAKVKPKKMRKKMKAMYMCDFHGLLQSYMAHDVPGRGPVCDGCGRDVEVFDIEKKTPPTVEKPLEPKKEDNAPTIPFRERMRVVLQKEFHSNVQDGESLEL